MDRLRTSRWKFEAILASMFAIGAAITAIVPDWIEAFGLEPDAGTGSAEWALVLALGVAALCLAISSRVHYVRRPRRVTI